MVPPVSEPRYFREINALVETIAKAIEIPPADVITAFEGGAAEIQFVAGEDGRRMISVRIAGKSALIGVPQDQ